jgi:hypothetical protein
MPKRNDFFLDEDEYPDDKDIDEFGDDAPPDFEPITIGYVGDYRPKFWTGRRIVLLIVALVIIAALVLPFIPGLF